MNQSYQTRDPGFGKTGAVKFPRTDGELTRMARNASKPADGQGDDELPDLLVRRVTRSDIVYVTSQLGIMVDTGISLGSALNGVCEQEDHPALKRMLGEIKADVEGGEALSSALAKHPKHFDKTYLALVKSSEQTGTLGPTLELIAQYQRREVENRSKVRAAMAYPAAMLCVAVAVTAFLLVYIMPKFAPLFSRRGVKLPAITLFFIQVSHSLVTYWYAWLLGAVLLVTALLVGRKTPTGRRLLDGLVINLPILGKTWRKVIISRAIRTLGAMLHNGVPMLQALQLTEDVSNNYYYARVWQHVQEEVTGGKRVSEALAGNKLLPRTLVQMIGSGEETGRLDEVLGKVSAYYDRECESSLKTATSLIEPLLICVMGGVVGSIAISLLLPIFTLSRPH